MKKQNFYKKLIARVKSAVKASRIPRSFSKKNNNVFSNEQHIIMQVLMQFENKRFRDMPRFLELLAMELNLPRIPCFTTINKFSLRVKSVLIENLITNLVKSNKKRIVAIDGTGFSLIKRSVYFGIVVGEIKQFIQYIASADIERKLITAVSLKRKKRNENIAVPSLMRKTAKSMKVSDYLGDRLYDSEKNHELAKKHGAKFIAPLKRAEVPIHRRKGVNRKKLAKEFPQKLYNKRSIIESIFSVIKRKFGQVIYSKKFKSQKNEVLFRTVAYNIDRLEKGVIINLLSTEPEG
jgi:transposase